jgi:hypothetical protein
MRARGRGHEFLVALFWLGTLLLAPPLLIVFNQPTRLLGVPTLYLYLFVVWGALIALVALVVERSHAADEPDEADTGLPGPDPRGTPDA